MLSRSCRQEAIAAATPGSTATTASESFFLRESKLVDGGVKVGGAEAVWTSAASGDVFTPLAALAAPASRSLLLMDNRLGFTGEGPIISWVSGTGGGSVFWRKV